MSRSLRFDAAAERELNEAVDFYDLESPGLGDVLLAEVEHALAQVEAFPEAAQPLRDGVRRHLLHTFPYALLYSLRTDEVRILAVAHQRRRPFYWEDRR
jgi:plasmid stabilization system protein ParE